MVLAATFPSRSRAMRRPHISIAHLLLVVLFCGVALGALRAASAVWASALFTLATGALLVAPLGIIYRRGRRQASWVGFALFGWGYLLLSSVPEVRAQLGTTALLSALHARLLGHAGGDSTFVFSPDGKLLVE